MISVHFYSNDMMTAQERLVSKGFASIEKAVYAAHYVVVLSRSFAVGVVREDDTVVQVVSAPSELDSILECPVQWPTFDDLTAGDALAA